MFAWYTKWKVRAVWIYCIFCDPFRKLKFTNALVTNVNTITRHVLQEMTVDTFIPNDTKILDDGKGKIYSIIAHQMNVCFLAFFLWKFQFCIVSGRIHIITGPNYSGKSIYIKQVSQYFLFHFKRQSIPFLV